MVKFDIKKTWVVALLILSMVLVSVLIARCPTEQIMSSSHNDPSVEYIISLPRGPEIHVENTPGVEHIIQQNPDGSIDIYSRIVDKEKLEHWESTR